MTAGGGFRFRHNSSTQYYSTITPPREDSVSKSGFESAFLQLRYGSFLSKNVNYSLEGRFRKSLYSNPQFNVSTANDFIVLGDAADELTLGGSLGLVSSHRNFFTGSLFFNLPNQRLSKEFLYQLESSFVRNKLAYIIGLEGVTSLKTGESPRLPIGTGATNLFNSVDRSYLAPYLGFNFAFSEKFRTEIKTSYRFLGKSTDEGFSVQAGLVYTNKESQKKPELERLRQFKEYSLESRVIKVSAGGKFVRIDTGRAQDVKEGMRFDFYIFDYDKNHELIASGYIIRLFNDSADLKIDRRYGRKISVKEGNLARSWQSE